MTAYAQAHAARPLNFVVAGGVAANGAVRAALTDAAVQQGFAFFAPALAYCTDNAAMIALPAPSVWPPGSGTGWTPWPARAGRWTKPPPWPIPPIRPAAREPRHEDLGMRIWA